MQRKINQGPSSMQKRTLAQKGRNLRGAARPLIPPAVVRRSVLRRADTHRCSACRWRGWWWRRRSACARVAGCTPRRACWASRAGRWVGCRRTTTRPTIGSCCRAAKASGRAAPVTDSSRWRSARWRWSPPWLRSAPRHCWAPASRPSTPPAPPTVVGCSAPAEAAAASTLSPLDAQRAFGSESGCWPATFPAMRKRKSEHMNKLQNLKITI